jgi:chromosomal replication initiation ATPase DnaA
METAQAPDLKQLADELREARLSLERIAISLSLLAPRSTDDSGGGERHVVRMIVAIVAAHSGFPQDQIYGRCRTENLAWARQIAMTLSREFTSLTLQEIGELFDRDHGTVHHAVEHVAARCTVNSQTKLQVESLRRTVSMHSGVAQHS